jgi:GWxTD domain-containing protein
VTRTASRIVLLFAAVLFAAGSASPSRKEQLAALPEEERAWLTDFVAPIILPEEEKLFLELTEQYQFEAFKEDFWERRERQGLRFPLGPGYRDRYSELRKKADAEYDGSREDAGRMVLARGEPGNIRKFEACNATTGSNTFRDLEVWTYNDGSSGQGATRYMFYRRTSVSPRKLWTLGVPDSDVLGPGSCRKKLEELSLDCPPGRRGDPCFGANCQEACEVYWIYSEIRGRQGSRAGAEMEYAQALKPAEISTEGLEAQRKHWAASSDAKAKPLAVVTPVAPARPVSKKEHLAALPEEERAWLTSFVAPIILPDEEKLFLELTEQYQRDVFKRSFWERREKDGLPRPFGPGFQKRYEELRPRLESEYDGWQRDAGRMVLHYGEPDEIRRLESCNQFVFRDLEIWTYQFVSGIARQTVHHIFYRPSPGIPRKLWLNEATPLDVHDAKGVNPCVGRPGPEDREIFQPGSCRKTLGSLQCDCGERPDATCPSPVCPEACEVYKIYREIVTRQGGSLAAFMESGHFLELPLISTEGLDLVRSQFPQATDPNARSLAVSGPSTRPTPEPTPAPEPKRFLSPEEIRDRIVKLEPKYHQFLELAIPLLTQADLSDFLQLSNKEKDLYIRNFWARRK